MLDAVNQKPIDSAFSKEPISVVLNNYVNSRVPVLVAGGVTTPAMANQVADYGVSMVAIGRTLIVNPDWVELTQNGQEDKITSILNLATVQEKKIPSKLMTVFEKIEGWVQVEA